MKQYEINGFYGSGNTPSIVFVYENRDGSKWYACEDSVNVNKTFDDVYDGIHLDDLSDVDCFTWPRKVNSLDDMIEAVEA